MNVTRAGLTMLTVLALSAPSVATAADEGPIKIYRLGNPASTISNERAETKEDLQRLMKQYESALMVALAQSDYTIFPEDLFAAAANAEKVSIEVGDTYHWMVFRNKEGQPTISDRSVVWSDRKGNPTPAWRLRFASGGKIFTFDIPVICLNLALKNVEDAPAPTCSLDATYQPSATCGALGTITVRGTGDDLRITGVTPGSATDAKSSGTNAWQVSPSQAGTFRFEGEVANQWGKKGVCSASVSVPAADPCPPVCSLKGAFSADPDTVTLDAGGSEGTVRITGVTLPDGSAGDPAAIRSEGGNRWTYSPMPPKKKGDYPYTFQAEAARAGMTDPCETTVSVPGLRGRGGARADGAWIARLYGASVDGDDSVNTVEANNDRTFTALDGAAGVGLALEYLFNDRIGLEGGIFQGGVDGLYSADRGDLWGMDEDDFDFSLVTLGVNFHLTPDRRADLYVGPFVGLVNYGTARFDLPFEWITMSFDDDFGIGAQIGVDIPFGASRWGFSAVARYLQTTAEQEGGLGREFDLDPLILGAGFSVRF